MPHFAPTGPLPPAAADMGREPGSWIAPGLTGVDARGEDDEGQVTGDLPLEDE